jgi:O-antigen/teichoic acid export membrane protein
MHLGKSVKYLGIANLMFYFFGYLTYLILGRVLGPAKFGIYGIIISLVTVVNMVVARGFCRAVTKFISEKSEKAEIIKRKMLVLQSIMSIIFFLIFSIGAKFIALHVFNLVMFVVILKKLGDLHFQ